MAKPNETTRTAADRRAKSASAAVTSRFQSRADAIAITPMCSIMLPSNDEMARSTTVTRPAGETTNRAMSLLVTAAWPLRSTNGEITHAVPSVPIKSATPLNTVSKRMSGFKMRQRSLHTRAARRVSGVPGSSRRVVTMGIV